MTTSPSSAGKIATAFLVIAALAASGCIIEKRPGPIENSDSRKIDAEMEFEGLRARLISLTKDRDIEVEGTNYSSMLEPDESWVVLNLEVHETKGVRTAFDWKRWFTIQVASGKVLSSQLARIPASSAVDPLKREWVSIFFKVRREDFPLRLRDSGGRIDREIRE